jgi:adenosine deaminase
MTNSALTTLIEQMPKTELHIHIEGTLEPEMMFEIARRNNIPLRFKSVEEVRAAYNFTNLQSFLDIYYEGAQVLTYERDFHELAWAYLEKVSKSNVKHVEMFFDPQTHTDRGVAFSTIVKGLHSATEAAREKLGMSAQLIMCFLRHLDEDSAIHTLEQSLPYKEWITAVGLDSGEVGNPPEKFTAVYERARKEGYLAVAHAGEEGPPDYIWQALDILRVKRIDHGVRCLEDAELVERLAKERIPLTVCPLSNLKLCVVKSLKDHPLKKLLDAGICATVNSDDPSYFGGYLLANYLQTAEALNLTAEDIATLARNGFEASFISDEEKSVYYAEIDKLVDANKTAAH